MKAATVYERRGVLYIHTSSRTTDGLWVLSNPVFTASGEDLDEAGRAIRTCLEASSLDVAPPRSFSGVFDPVLELAEARSYNAFVKSAKCCEIELQDEVMTFLPTRNEGAEEGFVPLGTKVDVPSLSDREVGAAAIKALSISE